MASRVFLEALTRCPERASPARVTVCGWTGRMLDVGWRSLGDAAGNQARRGPADQPDSNLINASAIQLSLPSPVPLVGRTAAPGGEGPE